jgi:hypothetical protein
MRDPKAQILRNTPEHHQPGSITALYHGSGLEMHAFLNIVCDMVDARELCLCPGLKVAKAPLGGECAAHEPPDYWPYLQSRLQPEEYPVGSGPLGF